MNLIMGREQWHSHEKSRTGERKAGSSEWRSAERMPVMHEEGRGGKGDCGQGGIRTGMCVICVC